VAVAPDPPPGIAGISARTVGSIWQIFGDSEYGIGRFEVTMPASLPLRQRFHLTFQLLQWRWQLVGVVLPDNIQNLLADELGKVMQAPAQRR